MPSLQRFFIHAAPLSFRAMACGLVLISAFSATAADLRVKISNISSAHGQILVSVHQTDAHWPEGSDNPDTPPAGVWMKRLSPDAQTREVSTVFEGLNPGRYAVAVLHDEDSNNKLNRQWFPFTGMPTEPYGFSGNQWSLFWAAGFGNCAFELGEGEQTQDIWLSTQMEKYLGNSAPP